MSEHSHTTDDDHDDATHGTEPLTGVDATELHAAVEALAAALHSYVDTAVGVRAEFGAQEADEDPRILSLESEIGALNATLYDGLHATLGLHADLTGMSWGDEDEGDVDAAPVEPDVETFHVGFVVTRGSAAGDRTLDSVLDVVEEGGATIAQAVVDSGFDVHEWGVSRGAPVLFDEDADDDE
ncbi:hypothetical protein [Cellulomonas edaphi]|uniref:Uncharacterized protein n=1 Tax=Cellulomonas edaphi TaxID=3053468 RepID=A0ABT7S5S0_9CELL|nr:hypothetical protein [Cellulomons edaphi]MDM7830859.1 hypothetical protein [Cellulomons edaphi]